MRARCLLLSVLVAACARRPAPPAPLRTLEDCRLPGVAARLRCGQLEVPEDRGAQGGRRLSLHVAVAPALAAQPEPDPLFILAGGPGQAASALAALLIPSLEEVRRHRDLVFLDQRGTGRSAPLPCDPPAAPDADLFTQLSSRYDAEKLSRCAAQLSPQHDLRRYGTAAAVEDLDQVRAALGYTQVNLWGASYGTRVALVYLRQHPDRVRSLVLDGVAPLTLVYPAGLAEETDRALHALLHSCAEEPACAKAYPELGRRFDALWGSLATPRATALPHPLTGESTQVTLTQDLLARTVQLLLYQPESAALVPLTLSRAADGDLRPLIAQAELVSRGFSEEVAMGMFLSVVCSEDVPLLNEAKELAAAKRTFAGDRQLLELLEACRVWPRGEVPPDFRDRVASDVPALLLSGELDPVTPPARAVEAAAGLTRARHIVFPAGGHGATLTACGRELVADFLVRGESERLDTSCLSNRRPPFAVGFSGPRP